MKTLFIELFHATAKDDDNVTPLKVHINTSYIRWFYYSPASKSTCIRMENADIAVIETAKQIKQMIKDAEFPASINKEG